MKYNILLRDIYLELNAHLVDDQENNKVRQTSK